MANDSGQRRRWSMGYGVARAKRFRALESYQPRPALAALRRQQAPASPRGSASPADPDMRIKRNVRARAARPGAPCSGRTGPTPLAR